MSANDKQTILLVASAGKGESHRVKIEDLEEYSPKLYDLSIASNAQTPGNGRVLLRVIYPSVLALIAYVTEKSIQWESYENDERPIMFKDLLKLAEEYEIDGLKQRTLRDFREWADPEYNDWEYVSNNVKAVCKSDFPTELYQEMIKVWAKYANEKSRLYQDKFRDAAYTVQKFGDAVQVEIARIGGCSS